MAEAESFWSGAEAYWQWAGFSCGHLLALNSLNNPLGFESSGSILVRTGKGRGILSFTGAKRKSSSRSEGSEWFVERQASKRVPHRDDVVDEECGLVDDAGGWFLPG